MRNEIEQLKIALVRPTVAQSVALGEEARRRGMKVETLVNRIVAIVVDERLFKAVLDE